MQQIMDKVLNVYTVVGDSRRDSVSTGDNICVVVFNHITSVDGVPPMVTVGDQVISVKLGYKPAAYFITTERDLDQPVHACTRRAGEIVVINTLTNEKISVSEYNSRKAAVMDSLRELAVPMTEDDDDNIVIDSVKCMQLFGSLSEAERKTLQDTLTQYEQFHGRDSCWASTREGDGEIVRGDRYALNFVATRSVVDAPRRDIAVTAGSIRSERDGKLRIEDIISGNISYEYRRLDHIKRIVDGWLSSLSAAEATAIDFQPAMSHTGASRYQYAKYRDTTGSHVYVNWGHGREKQLFEREVIFGSMEALVERHDADELMILASLEALKAKCHTISDTSAAALARRAVNIYEKLPKIEMLLGSVDTRSKAGSAALHAALRELRTAISEVETILV